MLQRIESIQLKTELKLKMNNPFGVDKKIINFGYDNIIYIIKQNITLSIDIEDIFRFITEQLLILLSNEICKQYQVVNFGQDILIPLLSNCFVLALVGKSKIDENIFDIIKINLNSLTLSEEKIHLFFLIDNILQDAFNYLYSIKVKKRIGIVGENKSGKKLFFKKILNYTNFNNPVNYYLNNFNLFMFFNKTNNQFYIDNYLFSLENRIFIIDSKDFELLWINFINKNMFWSSSKLELFLKKILDMKNISYSDNNIYFINKTDLYDTTLFDNISNIKKIIFLNQMSKSLNLSLEDKDDMTIEELNHMINFVIRCGTFQNFYWGSLYNGTNLKNFMSTIKKL